MPELLLLVGDAAKARNDNHQRFPSAFESAGWSVTVADHESLEIRANEPLLGGRPAATFDLIWPLGFGQQASFFDRMQILKSLDGARFVTGPDVLVYLHGKHRWLDLMPETHTTSNLETLREVLSSGGDWVLKPSAGSYGRDVQVLRSAELSPARMDRLIDTLHDPLSSGYLMAQRFVPSVAQGEKRTLVAGGQLIGTYLRVPGDTQTSNLATGARAVPACLSAEEADLVAPLATELADLGAGFAAIDTVYPYLMEVNVANPGGLETLERLEGVDLSGAVVRAVLHWSGLS